MDKGNCNTIQKSITLLMLLLIAIKCIYSESLVFPPYLHSYGIRKAGPQHLFMLIGTRTSFNDPQGLATTRLKSWDNPDTQKDDDEVIVYGVNSGRHQLLFNISMYSLNIYGKKGSDSGCFLFPKGVAANEKGDIYVADSGNNRVVRLFNPKGTIEWKGIVTGAEKGGTQLKGPSRVALDESGNVYVADPGNSRVVIFDDKGEQIRAISSYKQFLIEDGPTALVVADGSARWSFFSDEKTIFCADRNGTRLLKFTLDGILEKSVNLPEKYHACYGAVDYYHNYWITDFGNHCILKFDHNLQLLDIFGSYGKDDNQFDQPRGIAIYKRYGQTFIAERKGAQYFWVGTELKSVSCTSNGDGNYTIALEATEYSYFSLFFMNKSDSIFIAKRRMVFPGRQKIDIESNIKGFEGKSGTFKIEPTYSSYTYNSWQFPVTILQSP